MLGWEVFVHRQLPGESIEKPGKESQLGFWHTGLVGLDWLDQLVTEGRATCLCGGGYPSRYLAAAKDVIPRFPTSWNPVDSRIKVDRVKISACSPDEQLIIEAWDQS